MLFHLESGACNSGTDADMIDEMAYDYYPQNLLYMTSLEDDFPYFCPECDAEFSTLSGMFQHAEAVRSCSGHTVWPGCLAKLQHFIMQQL